MLPSCSPHFPRPHLCDELVVRHRHGDRAEELLEVVRQLGPSAVALAGGVQRDKDAGVAVDLDGLRPRKCGQADVNTQIWMGTKVVAMACLCESVCAHGKDPFMYLHSSTCPRIHPCIRGCPHTYVGIPIHPHTYVGIPISV
eukprot:364232-Chlamydomonas_euryale.AAC.1